MPKKIKLEVHLSFPKSNTNAERLFLQYYDLKLFCKNMTMYPFIVFKSPHSVMNIGSRITFRCNFPYFDYSFEVVDVNYGKSIKCEMSGNLRGTMLVNFYEQNNRIYIKDVIETQGSNWFTHFYYRYFVAIMHSPYMKYKLIEMYKNTLLMEHINGSYN